MTLSFTTPTTLKPGTTTYVRIFQRNDGRIITGSVILELQVGKTDGKPTAAGGGTQKAAESSKPKAAARSASRKAKPRR
jgi:hypothetical protein